MRANGCKQQAVRGKSLVELHAGYPLGPDRGVYGISVAAELVGMGVQNLRLYEARGLLEPHRTAGGTRRYSQHDLVRLARIGELLAAGLNLAGIGMVLDLEQENAQLRAEKEEQPWPATAPTRRRSRTPAPTFTTNDARLPRTR